MEIELYITDLSLFEDKVGWILGFSKQEAFHYFKDKSFLRTGKTEYSICERNSWVNKGTKHKAPIQTAIIWSRWNYRNVSPFIATCDCRRRNLSRIKHKAKMLACVHVYSFPIRPPEKTYFGKTQWFEHDNLQMILPRFFPLRLCTYLLGIHVHREIMCRFIISAVLNSNSSSSNRSSINCSAEFPCKEKKKQVPRSDHRQLICMCMFICNHNKNHDFSEKQKKRYAIT